MVTKSDRLASGGPGNSDPCVLLFILIEKGLNMIHMTMLPW